MRTRRTRLSLKVGLPMVLVLLMGCTETHRQRWNEFWGLDQPQRKPVVRGQPAASEPRAEPAAVAEVEPAKAQSAAPGKEPTDDVDRRVNDYVRSLPPRDAADYEPDDYLAKIRRQEDPGRRKHVKLAAGQRSPAGGTDRDTSDEDVGIREVPVSNEPPPKPGGSGLVRTASTADKDAGSTDDTTGAAPLTADLPPPVSVDAAPQPAVNRASPAKSPADVARPNSGGATANAGPAAVETPLDPADLAPVLKEVQIAAAPEPEPEPPPVEKRAEPTSPKPNTAPPPEPVDTFESRLAALAKRVSSDPNDIEAQYRLRLMYLIDGQDAKALAPIEGMDADIQEIIQAQIRALIAGRSASGRDSAEWANRQREAIEDLRTRVRARADLTVPKVVLCTAIDGFGRYEPIEPARFPAGRNNLVLIYIEVDNFSSKKTRSGLYRTLLSVRQNLFSKDGQKLWSKRDDNIEDLSREQRQDFYLTIGPISIPKSLAPGTYTLKVEVEDMLAGKLNSGVARFQIVP
ncbi:MAG: hypothetical protein ACE5E1_00910 [Phycisphaerae bacterium]